MMARATGVWFRITVGRPEAADIVSIGDTFEVGPRNVSDLHAAAFARQLEVALEMLANAEQNTSGETRAASETEPRSDDAEPARDSMFRVRG